MDIHFEPPKSVSETQRATADAARRNEELGVELSNEKQHRAMSSAATLRKEIFKSNNAAEKQLRRCHELELYNEGLRKKIQNVRKRQIDQSRMRGGETTTRENARLLKRQTEILEDKLSMAFKKFNTTLDKNSKLRQEIDRLTNERHIFDKVYTRIEEEVVLYEEETLQVETETADREKQCKEVRESIKEMIAKDREEAEKFEVLIAESQSKIKHTAQKNEVGIGVIPLPSSAKSARPASEQEATGAEAAAVAAVAKLKEDPLVAMAAATMDEALNEKTKAGTMTKEEEARLLARGARYRWEAVQNKAIIQKSAKKIAEIRNLMESLQEVSGVKDVDELAEVFRHNEDRMFELAGKINEDSKQVEVLQKEIDALSTDLDRDDGAKERRTKAKKQMQQIRETRHKSKRFVEMKQEADNEIVALNEALEDICRSMQGSRYRFELRSRYSSVGSPTTDELADDDSAIDGGDMGSTHSSTREKSSPPTNASVATELTDALSDDGTGTSHVMRNLGTLEHIYRVLARATNSNKFEVKRPEKFMERSVAVATKIVRPELNSSEIFAPEWEKVDDGYAIHTRAQSTNMVRRYFEAGASHRVGGRGRRGAQSRPQSHAGSRSRSRRPSQLTGYNSPQRRAATASVTTRRRNMENGAKDEKEPLDFGRMPPGGLPAAPGRARRSSWAGNSPVHQVRQRRKLAAESVPLRLPDI